MPAVSIEPTPENLRHYADWWFWARESLGGSVPRLRAAALAGMEAQSNGAGADSALQTARDTFQEGVEAPASESDPVQRYAELYARARLARRLDPEPARELAAEASSTWTDDSRVATAIRPRTNTTAIAAIVLLGLCVLALAVTFLGPFPYPFARSVPAFAACALGVFAFVFGLAARSRIRYSGEAGGQVADTSLVAGCLIAVGAALALLWLLLSGVGAFAPV
jgi:hypothetical protein